MNIPYHLVKHVVRMGAAGRLLPIEPHNPEEQIDAIFNGLAQSGRQSMTIYFHGGLVDEQRALGLAEHFYSHIINQFESYPVFFIWKSGWLETVESELLDVLSGSRLLLPIIKKIRRLFGRRLRRTMRAVRSAALTVDEQNLEPVLDALEKGRLPIATMAGLDALDPLIPALPQPLSEQERAELLADLEADTELQYVVEAITTDAGHMVKSPIRMAARSAAERDTGIETGYLSSDFVAELLLSTVDATFSERAASGVSIFNLSVINVVERIIQRFTEGTDHGLDCTIYEEVYRKFFADKIGKMLWDEMKENAADAYTDQKEEIADSELSTAPHGGALFLAKLQAYLAAGNELDLHLIGHSAGSIHIAYFLERARSMLPNLRFRNVILTAPAINIPLFYEKIVQSEEREPRIDRLRIFTMSDQFERADPLLKDAAIVYPHSLLYVISGLLEDEVDKPILGMDRHLRVVPVAEGSIEQNVRMYLNSSGNASVIYSVSPDGAPQGQQATFRSHYGSKDPDRPNRTHGPNHDNATLDSIAYLIASSRQDIHAGRRTLRTTDADRGAVAEPPVPQPLTLDEFMALITEEEVSEAQIAPYVMLNFEASKAFAPAFQINPAMVSIDTQALSGSFLLDIPNALARRIRHRQYQKKVKNPSSGLIRIVSEGDSWFQYPFLIEDIIDHLIAQEELAILSLGAAGDRLSNIVRSAEFIAPVRQEQPIFFLVSGGGNDLVAEKRLSAVLHTFQPGRRPADYLNADFGLFENEIRLHYNSLFSTLKRLNPALNVLCHGYDYAIPTDGPWLAPQLVQRGIREPALQREIIAVIIDRINQIVADESTRFDGVTYLDLRGTIAANGWYDELHPTSDNFREIAQIFINEIAQ